MSRSSIFDLLHQRHQEAVPVVETTARSDYLPDRLHLVDGVALTPAGFVARGVLPDAIPPELSESLHGPDGYRLLVHPIKDVMPLEDNRLKRLEHKAHRLNALVQTLMVEALIMLEALPEGAGFDLILTLPIRSSQAGDIILAQAREAIMETQYGDRLESARLAPCQGELHDQMAVPEEGGAAWALWLSADSLLNDDDVARLEARGVLGRSSKGPGLHPGEAVSALLLQRVLPDHDAFDQGWMIEKATTCRHEKRSEQRDYYRREQLFALLGQVWPDNTGTPPDTTEKNQALPVAPAWLVVDSLTLPGRAVEAGGALMARWEMLDLIDDGIGVDIHGGWPGEAMSALQLVLATARLKQHDCALVLNIADEMQSRALVLRACIGPTVMADQL
ncbi:hypothetical protein [Larsenimonas rhizosphaerae]|uniref:Uncharacterized protein n=1 Tax=Larsenimonas rhizosphaerae TaxID=2944682 RepID=A0AA42CX56_9GAMM|nr:hypothetical protein [Larsenimonas rhizosphaerae]MCM2130786.1 hypothetical protein [Larsenimonas rhizosphaerae]MCX2523490.1 hypothetical protein [Larsenimonas rhizosphaerae]